MLTAISLWDLNGSDTAVGKEEGQDKEEGEEMPICIVSLLFLLRLVSAPSSFSVGLVEYTAGLNPVEYWPFINAPFAAVQSIPRFPLGVCVSAQRVYHQVKCFGRQVYVFPPLSCSLDSLLN